MPELGLERPARKCQPEAQHSIREEAVVAELDLTRAELAEPPLDLVDGGVVVLLKNMEGVPRHAVYVPGRAIVGIPKGEGMAVDEDVLVRALELVLVREARAAEKPALDHGAGQMARGAMVVVGAVVDHGLPV